MRRDGHAHHAGELGRDDGAARRERVARGAGGGGDHEAVAAQAVDLVSRDRDVELDHVAAAAARDGEVVQREAVDGVGRAVGADELALDVEGGAVAHVQLAGERGGDRRYEVGRPRAGKKPEVAEGDAEDGDLGVADGPRGAQQGAVAAERDDKPAAGGVGHAVGEELPVVSPRDLDALLIEPGVELPGALDGVGARVVGDDKNLQGARSLPEVGNLVRF